MSGPDKMEPTYLVYSEGQCFQSRLVSGKDNALEIAIQFLFGEHPDPLDDPEGFDELVVLRNDFRNNSFWRMNGNIWESDHDNGTLVVVRVESMLN